ncbi:MAG TPA: DNA translocase FtsK 4TM domain-containing protein [Phycisphaerales bacterium]|nr:DNA translocase FtsK 4TM domain-containing protein [Phycisphaerales bacterium]
MGKSAKSTSTSSRAGNPNSPPSNPGWQVFRRMVILMVLAVWTFIMASLIGFDPADPPTHLVWPPNEPVANWCGPVGAHIAYFLYRLLGLGVWILMIFGAIGILSAAAGQRISHWVVRTIGLLMLTVAASGFQRIVFPDSGPFANLPGGLVGMTGSQRLIDSLGSVGTVLSLAVMALVGAVVAMDEWVTALVSWTWRRGAPAALAAGKTAGTAAGALAFEAGKSTAKASGGMLSSAWRRLFGGSPRVRHNDLDDDAQLRAGLRAREPGRKRRTAKAAAAIADADAEELTAEKLGVVDPDEEAARLIEERPARKGRKAKVEADEVEAEDGVEESDQPEDVEAEDVDQTPAKPGKTKGRAQKVPTLGDPAEIEGAEDGRAAAQEESEEEPDTGGGAPQLYTEAELRAKIEKLPVFFNQNNKQVATDADLAHLQGASNIDDTTYTGGKPYQFPGLDILENPEENFNAKLEGYVRDQAVALEAALKQYGIAGEVVGIESGPVITLYDVRLAPGTKVSAVSAISSDLARSLKAINIRIVPNQVGRDTIGVEVPNAQKEKVRLKELMSKTEKFASMKLPMFLGKDASGEPLIEDLAKMPHMLIAGTTGSGKSVCMNTIIMSFLYTKKPSELKMVLVDPKMVEMSQFKDIPHLMCPVVTEMAKAAAILEWACVKMDERYELLAEAGCRDIASYNELDWEELKDRFGAKSDEDAARIPRKLPYMVFIIDELADLMMTAKEVESHIIRIAQKARAVGMHLILATQRPQANVVTGLIKSNMPCRVAFRVASGMDSRIVLDQKGGELLLGHGDMLFLNPRTNKLTRAQGTLVDDQEIRRAARFMREIAAPSFERSLMSLRKPEMSDEDRALQSANNSSASLAAAQEDPLFPRAVEIVLETKRGSVSLLQRRLAIGYTRASRLIDLMGIAGIISDHKGSVARDVLISEAEWAAMKQLAAEQGVDMSGKVQAEPELFQPGDPNAQAPDLPRAAAESPIIPSGPANTVPPVTPVITRSVGQPPARSAPSRDAEEAPFETDEDESL